jgi:predicted enzyme related to lactoylglutathione lyase
MTDPSTVNSVLYPAPDVAAAVAFYGDALGLPVKFQDGARYAALDGGGVTVGVLGPEEDVTGGRVAASVRVPDVAAAVRKAVAAGATVVRPPERGPHEIRAVVTDPWGNPVVLAAKL